MEDLSRGSGEKICVKDIIGGRCVGTGLRDGDPGDDIREGSGEREGQTGGYREGGGSDRGVSGASGVDK